MNTTGLQTLKFFIMIQTDLIWPGLAWPVSFPIPQCLAWPHPAQSSQWRN